MVSDRAILTNWSTESPNLLADTKSQCITVSSLTVRMRCPWDVLDLGKEKYGGPFTTEQVEDVKVFYGILKVLFSLGAAFFLDFAADCSHFTWKKGVLFLSMIVHQSLSTMA